LCPSPHQLPHHSSPDPPSTTRNNSPLPRKFPHFKPLVSADLDFTLDLKKKPSKDEIPVAAIGNTYSLRIDIPITLAE
ncbi:hypothetical protein, partial [Kribbella albertanoniae]|uniref:hypothetical protein n=1 Tax=Kribbella albertanoniae TaxID=1266829 RepID=UPI001EE0CD5D